MQTQKAKTTQRNFWLWKYKNFHDICKITVKVFFIIIKLNNDKIHVSGLW